MAGLHISKEADGMEANFHIGLWKRTHKKYEEIRSGNDAASGHLKPGVPPPIGQQTDMITEEPSE